MVGILRYCLWFYVWPFAVYRFCPITSYTSICVELFALAVRKNIVNTINHRGDMSHTICVCHLFGKKSKRVTLEDYVFDVMGRISFIRCVNNNCTRIDVYVKCRNLSVEMWQTLGYWKGTSAEKMCYIRV